MHFRFMSQKKTSAGVSATLSSVLQLKAVQSTTLQASLIRKKQDSLKSSKS